jgi:serine/threonine-protein kinase HipA
MMSSPLVLDVALYGRRIGTLTLLPGDQTLFVFEQEYVGDQQRPALSLSFKDVMGELITDIRRTRSRLPPFFSNLLPEGALLEYLATKTGINPRREFFLLWMLGEDLPGAITIRAADGTTPLLESDENQEREEQSQGAEYHFSLAGVQLKFSGMVNAAGGATIPAAGVGGSWIIKFPSAIFDRVPENEFAMMELARAIGINVPEVRLIPLPAIQGVPQSRRQQGGNQALAVKRFDRSDSGERVHIEDFAQVFGVYPEKKYERASYRNLAEVIWLEIGESGLTEFIRRLVFNTLIGNGDMHLKNWSLIYPDRRAAQLSPGYDFVSTIAYLPDEKLALKLGHSKQMTDLGLDELAWFAAKARLPERLVLDTAKETVRRFLEVWHRSQTAEQIDESVRVPIQQLLKHIPLVREL